MEDEMTKPGLPDGIKAKISGMLSEMEGNEARALKGAKPVVLETEDSLWYVVYRTDFQAELGEAQQ
jgi:hypothetical protein